MRTMSRRRATAVDDLIRAREALARARDRGVDPWRLAELQLRVDALLDRAMAADDGGATAVDDREHPAPYGPADALPLAWLDESAAPRGRGRV